MGKMHGSLARAGKVKGVTPKQDKMVGKIKPKKGRAKKRQQYEKMKSRSDPRVSVNSQKVQQVVRDVRTDAVVAAK